MALHPAGGGARPLALPLPRRARLLRHERAQVGGRRRPQPPRHPPQESEGGPLRVLLTSAAAATALLLLEGDLAEAGAQDLRLGAGSLNHSLLSLIPIQNRAHIWLRVKYRTCHSHVQRERAIHNGAEARSEQTMVDSHSSIIPPSLDYGPLPPSGSFRCVIGWPFPAPSPTC